MTSLYNSQHLKTVRLLEEQLQYLEAGELRQLREMIDPYLVYREETGRFFQERLAAGCGRICFEKSRSGCCGREGIIVFFADLVVELIGPSEERSAALAGAIESDAGGMDCVYLGEGGCRWKMKPIACEMFICDQLREEILGADGRLRQEWEELRHRERLYTRPDRPVLFDDLERFFIERGVASPLMLFHHSPGLLRMKEKHGVGRLTPVKLS